ncbi:MAG TPA: endonuclease/exonuclease/phosphatase family protein [Bacillota bacterium]|nr:endonuclease/exonuclease/phosphatase family protein [Bacillota bacterium]
MFKAVKVNRFPGVSLSIIWLGFTGLHLLCTGNNPVWNVVGNLPPFLFAVIPLYLLLWELLRRPRKLGAVGIVFVALLLGMTQTDFNWSYFNESAKSSANVKEIRIFNWNTSFWDQNKDRQRFFEFLNQQKSDILILQEYLHAANEGSRINQQRLFSICPAIAGFPRHYVELDDRLQIRNTFPGFYFATLRQFVLISRFPILASHLDSSEQYAYYDLKIYGRVIRVFNVHILLHLEMENPFRRGYYEALQRRFEGRKLAFRNLLRDLRLTQTDYLIAGDFNSTKAMGVMGNLLRETTDAVKYSSEVIPVTITFNGLRLWRFDYVLLAKKARHLKVKSFKILDCAQLSDHNPQTVVLNLKLK